MTSEEFVTAGSRALLRDGMDAMADMGAKKLSARVVEAVEPLIRADERALNREAEGVKMYLALESLAVEVTLRREQFMRVTHTPADHPMVKIYDEMLALIAVAT